MTELCKVQGMIAERIKDETGYNVVFIYGIDAGEEIQCGVIHTTGMDKEKATAIAQSAKHFITQNV